MSPVDSLEEERIKVIVKSVSNLHRHLEAATRANACRGPRAEGHCTEFDVSIEPDFANSVCCRRVSCSSLLLADRLRVCTFALFVRISWPMPNRKTRTEHRRRSMQPLSEFCDMPKGETARETLLSAPEQVCRWREQSDISCSEVHLGSEKVANWR